MTIDKRLSILETKMKYMEKAIYAILAVVLADFGFTII